MKTTLTTVMTLIVLPMLLTTACAEDRRMHHHPPMHDMASTDRRISLGLQAPMRQHQLTLMREHLRAVRDIISDISAGSFDEASRTAHQKLGLTPEMKRMCNRFSNGDFRKLGLAFHRRADELGEVLKTRDLKRSLDALRATMNVCVECHSKFRQ